jgi:hypothetical protein
VLQLEPAVDGLSKMTRMAIEGNNLPWLLNMQPVTSDFSSIEAGANLIVADGEVRLHPRKLIDSSVYVPSWK